MRHGYLIDMDGVLYRGPELIPGADYFIQQLRERDIPFRFLTNNSQRTRRDVVAKLARMGIDVEEEHIFTCAMATARFLAQQKPGGTAFVIGEGGLLTALHQNGYAVVDHEPDYVVVGEGRSFNLELVEAVRAIADEKEITPGQLALAWLLVGVVGILSRAAIAARAGRRLAASDGLVAPRENAVAAPAEAKPVARV